MSPSSKNMGVTGNGPHPLSDIAPRAPFVKTFSNHPLLTGILYFRHTKNLEFREKCTRTIVATVLCVLQRSSEIFGPAYVMLPPSHS